MSNVPGLHPGSGSPTVCENVGNEKLKNIKTEPVTICIDFLEKFIIGVFCYLNDTPQALNPHL
jgi:hypothetical protein